MVAKSRLFTKEKFIFLILANPLQTKSILLILSLAENLFTGKAQIFFINWEIKTHFISIPHEILRNFLSCLDLLFKGFSQVLFIFNNTGSAKMSI